MDKQAALQYQKTLVELFEELRQATTPDLRAPIVARMHNTIFPLFVVDTNAAQHTSEALARLKYAEEPIVNAAHQTIQEAINQFRQAIDNHPEEPFVVYGESERLFARPVSLGELEGMRVQRRLFGGEHEPYLLAIDAPRHVEGVLRDAESRTLRPALTRLGFDKPEAIAFFTTRAYPKLGAPAAKMPSMTVCSMRTGIPIMLVRHRVLE